MTERLPASIRKRSSQKADGRTATTYEFPYMRQPEKKSFSEFLYDKEKGKVLGRTPKNWAQLLAFYTVFYTGLAALFTICMQGLLASLSDFYPKWQLKESLIGTNPGLGFRPMPKEVEQGSLIWYSSSNQTQTDYWVSALDDFLLPYRNNKILPGGGKNQKICDFDNLPGANQVCALVVDDFGPCSTQQGYSFNKSSPCIFLKLNRIYGWEPEYYDDINDLPEEMPDDLKSYITSLPEIQRKQIWVSCKGEFPNDVENVGKIEYIPTRGFPSYFYPFTNTQGYLSPLVAVRFARPKLNQIINVECRSWAKNIIYQGGRDRRGSVHFELMVDS
jgi:sodium/potassium-transporting ATPase subunit beta